jgi:predicted NAD-dependent protein-ADP-ribosyltransferase YbiA (DUF1768 family)
MYIDTTVDARRELLLATNNTRRVDKSKSSVIWGVLSLHIESQNNY